ncbi:transposase domain-containing protein [Streptomyces sp. SDT5-1]|uniref:transposase domain-containing protein n=1 Tax=Streptomyces sp. SDT5-1 TaxID=3406418 RepID=UPI003FD07FEE
MVIEPSATLALTAVVRRLPPDDVRSLVASLARGERRSRALPGWLTLYVVLAMALNPGASYPQVASLVWRVLPRAARCRLRDAPPTPAAMVRARTRLGVEPLRRLVVQLSQEALPPPAVGERAVLERVQLQRSRAGGRSCAVRGAVWFLRDASGMLLAVDLRGDSVRAAATLVRGAGAASLMFREVGPQGRSSQEPGGMLSQLRAVLPDTPIENGGAVQGVHEGLASRHPDLFTQELLARACVDLLISREMAQVLARPSGEA